MKIGQNWKHLAPILGVSTDFATFDKKSELVKYNGAFTIYPVHNEQVEAHFSLLKDAHFSVFVIRKIKPRNRNSQKMKKNTLSSLVILSIYEDAESGHAARRSIEPSSSSLQWNN